MNKHLLHTLLLGLCSKTHGPTARQLHTPRIIDKRVVEVMPNFCR